jgi:hypothetical protein
MSELNNIDNIVAYSYNISSAEERKKLEEKLKSNIEFQKEATIYFKLIKGLKALELESLNNNIYKWEKKYSHSPTVKTKTIKLNYFFKYAAAAILLMAFMPLGYNYMFEEFTSEDLFEKNLSQVSFTEKDNQLSVTRIINLYNSGISYYKSREYATSVKKLNEYLLKKDIDPLRKQKAQLYLASSLIHLNNITKAKILLEEIISSGLNKIKNKTQQEAEWYLVLCLLKEDNIKEVDKNLERICGQKFTHLHKDNALKLKKQIDKL